MLPFMRYIPPGERGLLAYVFPYGGDWGDWVGVGLLTGGCGPLPGWLWSSSWVVVVLFLGGFGAHLAASSSTRIA